MLFFKTEVNILSLFIEIENSNKKIIIVLI